MKHRLNHLWRVLATGWCFLSFSGGGLLLSLFVFPVLQLRYRDREIRRAFTQRLVHRTFRFFIGQMCKLGVMSVTLERPERLRDAGGVLVLASHPTLIDVVLMISLMPRAECIVKASLWDHRWFGGVVRAAGYIPNRGGPELVDDCRQVLARGNPLILFPEGTRTVPGQAMKFQRGAARLIAEVGVPVLPVIITCDPPSLYKGARWYQIPSRRFHVHLRVLDEMDGRMQVSETVERPLAARQMTQRLEQFFNEAVRT